MATTTHRGDSGRSRLRHCLGSGYVPDVPTVRRTPQHTVAIDDGLWQTARRIAEKRHEKVSDVLRQALVRYVARHKHLLDGE